MKKADKILIVCIMIVAVVLCVPLFFSENENAYASVYPGTIINIPTKLSKSCNNIPTATKKAKITLFLTLIVSPYPD